MRKSSAPPPQAIIRAVAAPRSATAPASASTGGAAQCPAQLLPVEEAATLVAPLAFGVSGRTIRILQALPPEWEWDLDDLPVYLKRLARGGGVHKTGSVAADADLPPLVPIVRMPPSP